MKLHLFASDLVNYNVAQLNWKLIGRFCARPL